MPAETKPQLFSEWIKSHARGTLNDEITMAMGEVVDQVTHLEKKGKVVIEITIEPTGSGRRRVMVSGVVTAKPPVPAPEASIFFAGEQGSLHRSDPFQERLVDEETGEIIEESEID